MTLQATALPFVFIVGCPRSGTTLLQRMLNAHPLLAVANDSHFIPRAIDRVGLDEGMTLWPAHVDFVRTYKRTVRLDLPAEAFEPEADSGTYPKYVSQIYRAFAAAKGKLLAGEKTPDYVKRIDLLHRLFPSAKFLHIIRDGREVVQSVLEWSNDRKGPAKLKIWDQNPFAVASLWWAHQVESGLRSGRNLDGLYMEVRYDELASDPEPLLGRIVEFLGIPDNPSMSAFHEGRFIDNPKLSAKSAWRPATPGLRSKSALSDAQLALFDALCGDLLDTLGMSRSGNELPARLASEADRMLQLWHGEGVRK